METSLTWIDRLIAAPTAADWQRLVELYSPLLAGWFGRAGVAAADRDDLVQEVLVVVVRRVAEFDYRGSGAFRGWLRGIVANHVRNHFRSRRATPAVDLDELADEHSALSRLWDREHDEHLVARVMAVVEGDFNPTTWRAFCRQAVDGRPAAEVAAETGLSLNAVILAKSRVMKRLRAELRGFVD